MTVGGSLVLFRQDLRLADNPAIHAACQRGGPIFPIYIWDPEAEAPWTPGGASRVWLHESLARLDHNLRALGSRLLFRVGPTGKMVADFLSQTGATHVFWNRRYEPTAIARDTLMKSTLRTSGVEVTTFNANLLYEPWELQTKSGGAYQVFTPFWNACLARPDPCGPLPSPQVLPPPQRWPKTETLATLGLRPGQPWDQGILKTWQPGEDGAQLQVRRFLRNTHDTYAETRDQPRLATSHLSAHLHFGELSPRQLWQMISAQPASASAASFLRELGWREFAHHLLFHFPNTPDKPLRSRFTNFPWGNNPGHLKAWQQGRTGYPLVDAGMRELWTTGFMHNRVRMVAASFLVKHLLLPWQAGARWFWDTLVDADLASNTLGWQWTAGCGADAAPYFRVFNPVLQGEKFDREGGYIRRWLPELRGLEARYIHAPWTAPKTTLTAAGVRLDHTYPAPIVDHAFARDRALGAYASLS